MKNPFDSGPSKADIEHQRNLARWSRMDPQMARVLPTQDREVQKIMGDRIEREWQTKARNSGQLFREEILDPKTGRMIEKYHGDIKAAYEPFMIPATPIKLTKTIWHKGRAFLETQIPDHVALERAAMKLGVRLPGGDE